ncbi:hypothetical protein ABZV93_04490 [Actinopolymorpha sp. NPDC004070]|uniref:hypothetical protein n=1 Tax=Actinopolymorpha sp. NPDC004070 TaxID=3154548 RepID=UPI0033B8DA4B
MTETPWRIAYDLVLPFGCETRPYGMERRGVIHVRAYEAEGETPIVIIGEFADHPPMQSNWQASTSYAASVQSYLYPEGRDLRYVLYVTTSVNGERNQARFQELKVDERSLQFSRSVKDWALRRPHPIWPYDRAPDMPPPAGPAPGGVPHTSLYAPLDHINELLPWKIEHMSFTGGGERALRWPEGQEDALGEYYPTIVKVTKSARVCIPDLLGDTEIHVWPTDLYTSERIGGPEAAALMGTEVSWLRPDTNVAPEPAT